jgi:hypothetical protein
LSIMSNKSKRVSSFKNHRKLNFKHFGIATVLVFGAAVLATSADAGFSVGSVGSAKSLRETPSTDIFGNSLDNLQNGGLTTGDLRSAGLDFSECGTVPLPQHILDYLETILDQNAADTSDWQVDLNAIPDCDRDAALWKIGQVNSNAIGHAPSDLTATIFDDAILLPSYTNNLLSGDSSKSISDIQLLFPNALATVSPSSIQTLIAETVLGFDTQAHALGYYYNVDRANFAIAEFEACYNSQSSFTPGANQCTIARNLWDAVAGVQNVADNSTQQLTAALVSGGLSLYGSTANAVLDPSNAVHLRYLENCIRGASDALRQLSTCNTGFTVQGASIYYIAQIAAGEAGYPASALTVQLLIDAGMTADAITVLATDINTLRGAITTSGLTVLSTSTDLDNWVTAASGFADGTSYSAVLAALANGWAVTDYRIADGYNGWSSSTADQGIFAACKISVETLTGGVNSCRVSKSGWQSLNRLAAASTPDDLTDDDLEGVIEATGVTDVDNAFGDLDSLTTAESDYLRDCLGSTTTAAALQRCVSEATPTTVPVFEIAQKIDGDYSGAITIEDLTDAGMGTYDNATGNEKLTTFLGSNTCGSNGRSSCLVALTEACGSGGTSACGDSALISSGSGATQEEVLAYLKSAALSYTQRQVDMATMAVVSGPRCSNIIIPAPAPCGGFNTAFTCTGLNGWTYTDNNYTGRLSVDHLPYSGDVYAHVRIRREAWWGGNAYQRDESVRLALTSPSNSNVRYAYTTQSYGLTVSSCRRAQESCTNAGGTVMSWSDLPNNQRSNQASFFYPRRSHSSGWSRNGCLYAGNRTCYNMTLSNRGFFPNVNEPWNRVTRDYGRGAGQSDCNIKCRVASCR